MTEVVGTNKRHVMSCSSLTRDSVVSKTGESLGKVEDIMIHIDSGRIAYAVLSFGGIGEKLFAVPWEALSLDEDEKHFILDIDKEQLERAPGFDKDNWPDMADPEFGGRVYSFYGHEEPSWIGSRGRAGSILGRQRGAEREDCMQMGTC